jgi:hypothetical protein
MSSLLRRKPRRRIGHGKKAAPARTPGIEVERSLRDELLLEHEGRRPDPEPGDNEQRSSDAMWFGNAP